MRLLVGTFLFSIASALVPVLNVEAYLAVVANRLPDVDTWQLAAIGAGGQMIGKLVWYAAGERTLRLKRVAAKMKQPAWQASYAKWHERINGRPVYGGVICLAAAFSGLPPFAVIAVLAGTLKMNVWVFLSTGLVGRTLRFWVVLEGAGFLTDLLR